MSSRGGVNLKMDKGPTNIVTDKQQNDGAVVNGVSCMSCHVRPIRQRCPKPCTELRIDLTPKLTRKS